MHGAGLLAAVIGAALPAGPTMWEPGSAITKAACQ
jgi:hypothetical protein